MPSINAMSIMAGAAAAGGVGAGMYSWGHTADNPNLDSGERFYHAGAAIAVGVGGGALLGKIGGGALLGKIGIGNLAKSAGERSAAAGKAVWGVGKAFKGANAMAKKLGAGSAPWLKGPMKLLALTAATVGVMAYGSRSNPQTTAYASRDDTDEVDYDQRPVIERMGPIRERLSNMGATGDMVFGMNNLRHG